MSAPMKPWDPAYFLLERGLNDPTERSTTTVFNENCYICKDPEFSLMGLPLCFACDTCGAHVPADDVVCDSGHESLAYRGAVDGDHMQLDSNSSPPGQ